MSVLQIYKASAGSGKTFRLAGEYIDLLFKNPRNYKGIIAVTFTNKASAEMKNRITDQLYRLSEGKHTGYTAWLSKKYNLSPEAVKEKASRCLNLILHDYSKFSVETIDSFFQKIITGFVKEMGIQAGYNVELDENYVLQQVIDNMLYEIENDEILKKWLIQFAENKIEEGKSWNIKNDILSLGNELFKERFKISKDEILKKTSDKNFLYKYISSIHAFKNSFVLVLKEKGQKALEIISKYGLSTDDFSRKQQGIGGFFQKIADGNIIEMNTYVQKCTNNSEEWYTKDSIHKEQIRSAIENGLMQVLTDIVSLYKENFESYNTIRPVLSYIPALGLLSDLINRIKNYTSENNSFLISDSSEFLYKIIGQNDAPFVYEKTGTYYKYFMIDEFQDTSILQWHNFKPLILNSLSESNSSLVVGDVKQSIYRWRNSDWKILSDQVTNDFANFRIRLIDLDENWRSCKNIILFNNSFFNSAVNILQQQLKNDDDQISDRISNVYKNLDQKIPDIKRSAAGCVNVEFYDNDNFNERVKISLVKKIELLQDSGYLLKDIAILVRTKSEGKEIADFIIEYKNQLKTTQYSFDFISNDSLFISNNPAIKIIILTLKYIINNEDRLTLYNLITEFQYYIKENITEPLKMPLKGDNQEPGLLAAYLPADFFKEINNMKNLGVYDLVEHIIDLFTLNKHSDFFPYLQAFLDLIHEFSKNKTTNLNSFIDWWEETGISKTISVNENQNAVKIITIHKSKGLQFKNVLIPFCNWSINHSPGITNIVWCKNKKAPFNDLDSVPVRYSSGLLKTHFKDEYLEEKLNAYVDNLNLLYVALTRAEEGLYVWAPSDNKESEKNFKHTGHLMYRTIKSFIPEDNNLSDLWNEADRVFKFGETKSQTGTKKEVPESSVEFFPSEHLFERYKFTQSADNYFNSNKEWITRIDRGNLMHMIFQQIKTGADVKKTINKFIIEGKLNRKEADIISKFIFDSITKAETRQWFDGTYKIKTETDIINENGSTYRPDRVMWNKDEAIVVDYKFGEHESKSHHSQVRNYMNLVRDLRLSSEIKGYVWYVDLNVIKKVD